MKKIGLTQGKVAFVDDEDFKRLSAYKWCVRKQPHKTAPDTWYAVRSIYLAKGKYRTVHMHREILGITDPKVKVDHRDYDGLNNRKANLRAATNQQNLAGRRHPTRSLPQGVTFIKPSAKGVHVKKSAPRKPYSASIRVNGQNIYLGVFATASEAGEAYKKKHAEVFGEFSPYAA